MQDLSIMLMPSHSPELQLAERLWPLVNQAIANRTFKNLDPTFRTSVCNNLV